MFFLGVEGGIKDFWEFPPKNFGEDFDFKSYHRLDGER